MWKLQIGSEPSCGVLEVEFHDVFAVFDFAGEFEAEFFVEVFSAAFSSYYGQGESLCFRSFSHAFYH